MTATERSCISNCQTNMSRRAMTRSAYCPVPLLIAIKADFTAACRCRLGRCLEEKLSGLV